MILVCRLSIGVRVLVKFHQKHSFVILMKIALLKCDINYTLHAHIQLDKQLAKLNPRTQNPIEKEEMY